jgi:hypothetical protein
LDNSGESCGFPVSAFDQHFILDESAHNDLPLEVGLSRKLWLGEQRKHQPGVIYPTKSLEIQFRKEIAAVGCSIFSEEPYALMNGVLLSASRVPSSIAVRPLGLLGLEPIAS